MPARVRSKLALYTPERELVDAYLYEIARGYNVDWTPEPPASSGEGDDDVVDSVDGVEEAEVDAENVAESVSEERAVGEDQPAKIVAPTVEKEAATDKTPKDLPAPTAKKLSPEEELAQRFERLKKI